MDGSTDAKRVFAHLEKDKIKHSKNPRKEGREDREREQTKPNTTKGETNEN